MSDQENSQLYKGGKPSIHEGVPWNAIATEPANFKLCGHRGALVTKSMYMKTSSGLTAVFSHSFVLFLSFYPCLVPSHLLCYSRGDTERCSDQVLLYVDSQCHCAPWEDKDSIEEAGMEQGVPQYTLTGRLVLCQVSLHTHNRHCVQFLPTPSFVLCAPPPPPIPSASSSFFFFLFRAG